jgi:hypothetical protein
MAHPHVDGERCVVGVPGVSVADDPRLIGRPSH